LRGLKLEREAAAALPPGSGVARPTEPGTPRSPVQGNDDAELRPDVPQFIAIDPAFANARKTAAAEPWRFSNRSADVDPIINTADGLVVDAKEQRVRVVVPPTGSGGIAT
jgi:hypothetical protein